MNLGYYWQQMYLVGPAKSSKIMYDHFYVENEQNVPIQVE